MPAFFRRHRVRDMVRRDTKSLLRRVRALGGAARKMPAVALTAFARSEDRTKALRAMNNAG